jgi:hypothetical protein
MVECDCGAEFECHLSHQVESLRGNTVGTSGTKRSEVNLLLAAGSIRAGLGRAGVQAALAPLGVNVPGQTQWTDMEDRMDDVMSDVSMKLEEDALLQELAATEETFTPVGPAVGFFGPKPVKRVAFQCVRQVVHEWVVVVVVVLMSGCWWL